MATEKLSLVIDGEAVATECDPELLRHGCTVYARQDGDGVTLDRSPMANGRRYMIVSVSLQQPEGIRYVTLMREPIIQPMLPGQVLAASRVDLAASEVEARLRRAAVKDVPFEKLLKEWFTGGPRVRCIQAVVDRLALIEILGRPDVGSPLWVHFRGLVAYLLLTCIDLLGQDSEYKPFHEWLDSKSKKVAEERTLAVSRIPAGSSPLEATRILHEAYSEQYSVGRGFKRFIRDRLPEKARRDLLATIRIEKRVSPAMPGEEAPADELGDEKKIQWLFDLRNGYTHRAEYVPGHLREAMPPEYQSDDNWWRMADRILPETITEYSVSGGWLDALEAAVRAGLATLVNGLDDEE